MKTRNTLFLLLFLLALQIPAAFAEVTVEVRPTGEYPADVEAIQAVVDEYGALGENLRVVLKAHNSEGVPTAFNFGTDPDHLMRGSVVIRNEHEGDVTFQGQLRNDAQAAIMGGFVPIYMQRRRGNLVVFNIEFSGAFLHAISVRAAQGAVIRNNTFLDTMGFPLFRDPEDPSQGLFPVTAVIFVLPFDQKPHNITGTLRVTNNIIDTVTAGFSDGVTIIRTDAVIEVQGNQISGVNVGVRQFGASKSVNISHNDISAQVPAPGFFSAGIQNTCNVDNASAAICDNHISVVDPTLEGQAIGLSLAAAFDFGEPCDFSDSLVRGNDITIMGGFSAGIDLSTGLPRRPVKITNNVIASNTVRGTALAGIVLRGPFPPVPDGTPQVTISKNTVKANDFTGLETPEFGDVRLDESTSNNRVVVQEGDVVSDVGTGNTVFTKLLP